MEDFEINILRRNGNWKKVKSKDLLLDTVDQNEAEYKHIDTEEKVPPEPLKEENFLNDINEVNSIIAKLEKLENDKTLLKDQLKIIEAKFLSKKHQTEEKIKTIKSRIRKNCSPKHVPSIIIKVPEIPRTKSGKIVELAVRKVIHGETINNKEAIANPESLKFFENLSQLKL